MKYVSPLIVVEDMARSRAFYEELLDCRVVDDFGANVTMTGGFSLQTMESWKGFLHTEDVRLGGNDGELYFESENLDAFLEKLEGRRGIRYVHPLQTHSWGQRAVRFYDPDGHIIEVGESLGTVARRFLDQGMDVPAIARRMDVPEAYVENLLRDEPWGA